MSYMDRGFSVATSGCNGRPTMKTGEKSCAYSPWERLGWALLELAIDDTAILCRYGLIDREGELLAWPKVRRTDHKGRNYYAAMTIACMDDGLDHGRLRDFWTDPTQAQVWCDYVGCKLSAEDIWKSILKNHAK